MISNVENSMEKFLVPVSRWLSTIGSSVLVIMVVITVADVVGRKLFNMPVKGAYELGEMLLVIVVFLNMPDTEMQDDNVSIELLYTRFGKKVRKIVLSLMYVLFFIVSVVMTWQLIVFALGEMAGGFTTTILSIPYAPVVFLASLGCALLSLVVLARLFLMIFGGEK